MANIVICADGTRGKIHKSRNHVYRLKSPLHRSLIIDGKLQMFIFSRQ